MEVKTDAESAEKGAEDAEKDMTGRVSAPHRVGGSPPMSQKRDPFG